MNRIEEMTNILKQAIEEKGASIEDIREELRKGGYALDNLLDRPTLKAFTNHAEDFALQYGEYGTTYWDRAVYRAILEACKAL